MSHRRKRQTIKPNNKYDGNKELMKQKDYFRYILIHGYYRDAHILKLLSPDIELLCASYLDKSVPKLTIYYHKLTKLDRKSGIMNIHFKPAFFDLYPYEQRVIARQMLLNKYKTDYSIINITTHQTENTTNYLFGIECILSMHTYSKHHIKCLNLNNLDLTDDTIWNLCVLIENVCNYNENKTGKLWSLDIEEINLSNNNITDRYLYKLSQIINKHFPKLKILNLKRTKVSNKCIPLGLIKYTSIKDIDIKKDKSDKYKQKKRKKKKYKSG
eukprot:175774_1